MRISRNCERRVRGYEVGEAIFVPYADASMNERALSHGDFRYVPFVFGHSCPANYFPRSSGVVTSLLNRLTLQESRARQNGSKTPNSRTGLDGGEPSQKA